MPLATDAGGFPEVGGLARYNPATGNFPSLPGLSAINLGPFTKPLAGELTQVGTGTLTATDEIDRLQFNGASNTTHTTGYVRNIIAAPYTLDAAVGWAGVPGATDTLAMGLFLYDGTKFWEVAIAVSSAKMQMIVHKWTNSTTSSATPVLTPTTFNPTITFLRITDDGTTTTAYYSNNGKDYAKLFSEATGTFLTPTKFGCHMNVGVTSPVLTNAKAWIYHLSAVNGILGDAP